MFDLLIAGVGLLILWPLGLIIGLAIKISDGGPVFYGQTRIGQFGRPFRIWKFRSMVVGADKIGACLTQEQDPRITRVGRLLRQTKLDELPQLWNVWRGEMSFVGPRPEVPRYVALYTPAQREILKLKPGITDLASLLFRHEETLLRGARDPESFYLNHCLPAKIELNGEYAQRATVIQDIWIVAQTAGLLARDTFDRWGARWVGWRLRRKAAGPGSPGKGTSPRRVAVIGTGGPATNLVLNLRHSEHPTRRVVAFFDDNPRNWHKRPHDIPVVGMPECLLNGEWSEKIDEVIVSLSAGNAARARELAEMLKPLHLPITIASS